MDRSPSAERRRCQLMERQVQSTVLFSLRCRWNNPTHRDFAVTSARPCIFAGKVSTNTGCWPNRTRFRVRRKGAADDDDDEGAPPDRVAALKVGPCHCPFVGCHQLCRFHLLPVQNLSRRRAIEVISRHRKNKTDRAGRRRAGTCVERRATRIRSPPSRLRGRLIGRASRNHWQAGRQALAAAATIASGPSQPASHHQSTLAPTFPHPHRIDDTRPTPDSDPPPSHPSASERRDRSTT